MQIYRKGGLFLKRRSFFRAHIESNRFKYICGTVLIVAGIIAGCTVMHRLPVERAQMLVEYFSKSASYGESASFAEVFRSCLLSNLKYTVIYFLLSLTVYTAWSGLMLAGAKGFAAGFTAVFLIKNYGAHGAAYTLLAILPSAVIVLPVYLFAGAVCINFAADRRMRGEAGARTAFGIVPALAVIYGAMAICSLYDAAVAPFIFKRLF